MTGATEAVTPELLAFRLEAHAKFLDTYGSPRDDGTTRMSLAVVDKSAQMLRDAAWAIRSLLPKEEGK